MCDHIIGLLYVSDYTRLVNRQELQEQIDNHKQHNEYISDKFGNDSCLKVKEYDWDDYADKRKNTNIIRFDYCPFCGEKINWKNFKKSGGVNNE